MRTCAIGIMSQKRPRSARESRKRDSFYFRANEPHNGPHTPSPSTKIHFLIFSLWEWEKYSTMNVAGKMGYVVPVWVIQNCISLRYEQKQMAEKRRKRR